MNTFLGLVSAFILLLIPALIVRVLYRKFFKKNPHPKTKVTVQWSGPSRQIEPVAFTGTEHITAAEEASRSEWKIVGLTNFPFTIYKTDYKTFCELRAALRPNGDLELVERKIYPIILNSTLQCKEVDQYIQSLENKVEIELGPKRQSPEWLNGSDLDREDIQEAIWKKLDETESRLAWVVPSELVSTSKFGRQGLKQMVDRYGQDATNTYAKLKDKIGHVQHIAADGYYRTEYESLVEKGLAIRGTEVGINNILDVLTLKELNEVAIGTEQKPFGRKQKAIEFLQVLPDIEERIGKIVSLRSFFCLIPPSVDLLAVLEECERAEKYVSYLGRILSQWYQWGSISEPRPLSVRGTVNFEEV